MSPAEIAEILARAALQGFFDDSHGFKDMASLKSRKDAVKKLQQEMAKLSLVKVL
jgi:hypothetical protein